jgi:riboflavin synthase
MFTGIITDIGKVRALKKKGDTRIEITTQIKTDSINIGASICCSGACLTVIEKQGNWFAVQASGETLSKTVLGSWALNTPVNLERALKVGDEMGGHIVSGHVDGIAQVTDVHKEGDSLRVNFRIDDMLKKYVVPKGSITLNGVSLTINEVDGGCFGVNLVPHTQVETTLGKLSTGEMVNVEIDMLARYIARLLENPHS